MDINVLMTYCLLLKDKNAISCCDYSHTSFVLQDFDEPNKRLKVHKYYYTIYNKKYFSEHIFLI